MLPLDANQTTLVLDATVFYRFRNNRSPCRSGFSRDAGIAVPGTRFAGDRG